MPAGKRPLPASRFLMLSGMAQEKTPLLPACLRCYCTTNSRLVTIFFVRITPTGLPVHLMRPSLPQLQVGLQLTLVKSTSASPASRRFP